MNIVKACCLFEKYKCFVFFIFLFFSVAIFSAPIRVGVINSQPFVLTHRTESGGIQYNGFIVALWKKIALEAKLPYQFVLMSPDIQQAMLALQKGKIDVLIGQVPVSRKNVNLVDFSRPIYIGKQSLLVEGADKNFFSVVGHILMEIMQPFFIFCVLLFFIYSAVLCYIERREGLDPEFQKSFPRAYLHALYFSFYLFLKKFTFKQPATKFGKIWTMLGIVFAMFFLASVTALVTTSLTITTSTLDLGGKGQHLGEFFHHKIAVVRGSYADYIGMERRFPFVRVHSLPAALKMLDQGKVTAIMDNDLVLRYFIRMHPDKKIALKPIHNASNEIAIAFSKKSHLLGKVNLAITKLQDMGDHHLICLKYLGSTKAAHCLI